MEFGGNGEEESTEKGERILQKEDAFREFEKSIGRRERLHRRNETEKL